MLTTAKLPLRSLQLLQDTQKAADPTHPPLHLRAQDHKRRIKVLMGARPHNQADADWAAGMGPPDNGPRSAAAVAAAMDE